MYFLVKLFYFLLAFNYVVTEFDEIDEPLQPILDADFDFHAMALGHSGILISWELINATKNGKINLDFDYLQFKILSLEQKTNMTLQISKRASIQEYQYKIHSLNESTLYEVSIEHYSIFVEETKLIKLHSVEVRTTSKTNAMPAKPGFELIIIGKFLKDHNVQVKWFPCGKERNCHDDEAGTHFGTKIKAIADTFNSGEAKNDEYQSDSQEFIFWPGKMYEVAVYSVNGEREAYSDPQEVFIEPKSTPVQYVNEVSLSNSSVLITWEPPRHSVEQVLNYLVESYDLNQDSTARRDPVQLLSKKRTEEFLLLCRKRIYGLKPEMVYIFIITPMTETGFGFEYRMKYTLQVYTDEMPIARPDFDFVKRSGGNEGYCMLEILWLPCGRSSNCRNTKPGSECSIRIDPSPSRSFKDITFDSDGSCLIPFDYSEVYEVTVTSKIGNISSKPVKKKFKDCSLYELN